MIWRKGFTLVELLIVVTILAILAGAAVPYVQDYVEDSRYARAKADLEAIKNALVLYETKRNELFHPEATPATYGTNLVQKGYLMRLPIDPWGAPYYIEPGSGTVRSYGPDGQAYTGDDISTYYQPGFAIRSAYWFDANASNLVDPGDQLLLIFSRPIYSPFTSGNPAAYITLSNGDTPNLATWTGDLTYKSVLIGFGAGQPTFIPGKTTITTTGLSNTGAGALVDRHSPPKGLKIDTITIMAR